MEHLPFSFVLIPGNLPPKSKIANARVGGGGGGVGAAGID